MSAFQAGYLSLLGTGVLVQRAAEAYSHLEKCDGCGWACGCNRLAGRTGVCRTGIKARVASYGPHHGEELPLRGWRGSGTLFFASCSLRCQYCQNAEISQAPAGKEMEPGELGEIMLDMQSQGCHNINLVTPSHVIPQVILAVLSAARGGLTLPLVFNTGGFDSITMLKLLDGIIDIYMPDMKYSSSIASRYYSKARDYPAINQAAVREMYRQVGDLQLDEDGLAQRGLLVRHLVLPNGVAGTAGVVAFLAGEISKETYINLMDQYRPEFQAHLFPKLNRRLKASEYNEAVQLAQAAGLHRIDHTTFQVASRNRLW